MKMNLKNISIWIFINFVNGLRIVSSATSNRDGGCDPVVDILFVLDTTYEVSTSDISAQINFIRSLLREHTAPSGAVRVALMTCGDVSVSASQFTSSYKSLLNNYGQNYYTTRKYKNRQCLESVNFKFKSEARAAASRIAIIMRWSWAWEEGAARQQSEVALKENTVLVVVAIGIRDFGSLSAMQSVAYSKATFFVVSNSSDLNSLAKDLSKGSCRPISLDLRSETSIIPQTTMAPVAVHDVKKNVLLKKHVSESGDPDQQQRQRRSCWSRFQLLKNAEGPFSHDAGHIYKEPCILISERMFKRYVPGFGYTRQRCDGSQTLDLEMCRCI